MLFIGIINLDCISGCKMCDDGTVCLACYEAHYTVTADNGDITSCLREYDSLLMKQARKNSTSWPKYSVNI